MIHVFIGTKAQYIKTAPLLRLMDDRGVRYRLIDSGQHASLSESMRAELGVRSPDLALGKGHDVTSIPQAFRWMLRLGFRLASGKRLRRQIFGGEGGVCVVHGDTPSTLLSTLMARRAGLEVAHIEAGLRSGRLFHPFPEEIVRILVMRRANLLFAPDAVAVANLAEMEVEGRVVELEGNTSVEAVRAVTKGVESADGPVVVTMHRVENLHRRARRDGFVDLVESIAANHQVRFVAHEPTRSALEGRQLERLADAGVEVTGLTSHESFVRLLTRAPFVVTDGGSVQEECALLGVPTLLWRDRSERPDGLGDNIVLSHYRRAIIDDFVADPGSHRREARLPDARPSEEILAVLLDATSAS